jgi:hypothetical protein
VWRRSTDWNDGFDFRQEQEINLCLLSRQVLGSSQLRIHWGPGSISSSVNWPVHEGNDLSPSNAGLSNDITIPEFSIHLHTLLLN